MPEFILHKMVRDKIPDIMLVDGQTPDVITLHGDERAIALLEKVKEEADEAIQAIKSGGNVTNEIADMEEASDNVKIALGIGQVTLTAVKDRRRDAKGGFQEGRFVETVQVEEGSEWAAYYRQEPDRFIEK